MLQFTLNGRLAADPVTATYGADRSERLRLRVASKNPGSQNTDFYDVAIFNRRAVEALRDARMGDPVRLSGVGGQNVWHTDAGDRRETIALVARKVVDHTPTAVHTAAGADRRAARSANAGATR